MPQITYGVGNIVLYKNLYIAIIMPDSKLLFPPVQENTSKLPYVSQFREDDLFPMHPDQINRFSDEEKRIIATALCVLGVDFSWIKIGPSGMRQK
jgi:hypothetical protein